MEYRYKPTTHGRAVIAACMSLEKPFRITRVAFGSGTIEEDVNLADIHQLLSYVSDGAVAERHHKDDRFNFTIQFANVDHKEVKTFMLSEFMVYVNDPATGEETDLLYGTLGAYQQTVPGYNMAYPPSVFNFPIELIISDEVNVAVSAPAGLVTYADLIQLLNHRAAGAAQKDITVPTSGWQPDNDTNGAYQIHVDIASMDIAETMIPVLAVNPRDLETAAKCGLCPTCRTLNGMLRLYAKGAPDAEIGASLTMLETVPQDGGLSSSAATARMDIIIPENGWEENAEEGNAYAFSADIPNTAVKSELIPMLTIFPEHLELAKNCGLSPYTRSLPERLRVYAQQKPEAPISASLALLGVTQSITGNITGEGGGAFEMPIATETQLGVVRLGEGLVGTPDGTVSVKNNSAEDKDVEDMLGEVYPANNN